MQAHYTVYLILISFMRAEGKLHWTIENKISDYGQNLTLMCSVVNCCSKAAGWEVWEPTLRTLFIDIRNWTVPATSKYTGDVHNFGYTLVIRNVSQEDLNITYTCVYGVERSDKKMLIESDIFFSNMEILGGHKQNKSTLEVAHQMKQFNKPNNDINIELVIGLTVPGVLMVIVGLTFVYLKISHRKPRPISKKNSEEGPTAMKEGNNGETEMLIKEDEEAVNRKEKITTLNRNVGTAQTVNIDKFDGTFNSGVSIEDPVKNSKRDTLKTVNPDHLLPFTGTSEEFSKLLSTGTYESFENRVFLCGSCACGKSTLASVLIGSPIPRTWESTDGLVIHFGRNGINLDSFEMVPLHGEDRGQNVLTKVVIGKPTHEPCLLQSSDTHLDQHIATSLIETDSLKSSRKANRNEAGYSLKDSQLSDACLTKSQDLPRTNTGRSEIKNTPSISVPKMKKIEAYAVHDDILNEVKSGQYKIRIAPSDLVDFGGQRSYDMTHQLFVQHGGTFVIMFDGSRDFHKPLKEYPTGNISNESIVRHWVNSILTYCVDDSDVMPMIVFAATHRDLLSEDLQKKNKADFVKKVTDMFGSHERKKHFVFDPVFFINGTDKNDQEIQNLKKQLVTIAQSQPSWGLRRPMVWVPLELLISNMKKDNVNIIFKSHLAEANKMNGDLALSDKQLDEFLLTQHALGKIMYFNQPDLNNFIILYPPALVNILRSFITDEMFWPEDKTLRNILRAMTDTGKIYKKDLLKLWQQKRFHTHIPDDDFKEFVIRVLIHLDVLVLPKRYSDKSNPHVDYYLVPCTVKAKMPMSFLDDKSFANRTLSLVYRLQQSSIPSALSFKLIGAVSGIWPIMELNGRPLLYHSSAVLSVDGKTEFRMIVEDTKVIVYLTHMLSKSSISPDIAASIQECLTATLEVVLKFYLSTIGKSRQMANLSKLFQIEVGEVCGRSPCMVSISKATLKSGWVCDSGNEHSSKYPLLWFFNKTQEECPSFCQGLAKNILQSSPSELHLSRFADQLSYNSCRELVMQLGLQQRDWDDIENCYRGMPVITRIMALQFWKTKRIKGKPTKSFSNLLDALIAIDNQQHLLCKVFREDTDLLDIADVRLQEVPNDDVLFDLPKYLGNCAIQLGIELGITMSSISETMVGHHKDMYSQISDILRKWKSSGEVKPTIYRLMLTLERVDIGGLDYLKNVYLGH